MGFVEDLKLAIGIKDEIDEGPNWERRLAEAAYTSPSGNRLTFYYEDVKTSFEKKTAAFDFPDADGTYVQDNGLKGRKFPLRLIFWGKDHDTIAKGFESLLRETGRGVLEHPMYGTHDVVPFGTISRRDDLKRAANQTVIECTFWASIALIYPSSQTDAKGDVNGAVDDFNAAAAAQFDQQMSFETPLEEKSFLDEMKALRDKANNVLEVLTEGQQDLQAAVNDAKNAVNAITDPVNQLEALATATQSMLQLPGTGSGSASTKLDSYGSLTDEVTGQLVPNANSFHTKDINASTYIAGSVLSVVNSDFATQSDAIGAATVVAAQMDVLAEWRENNYATLAGGQDDLPTVAGVDMGGAYAGIQNAVALCISYLVEISFTLNQERILVLDRPRNIVELAAEIYGDVDSQLDFLITSNNLTGSEILELPKGKSIAYYV